VEIVERGFGADVQPLPRVFYVGHTIVSLHKEFLFLSGNLPVRSPPVVRPGAGNGTGGG
jgi:hypothetical protein